MLCCFTERDEVSSSSPVLFLPGSGFAQHLITQRFSPSATEISLHLQLSLSISVCLSVRLSSTDGVRMVVLVKFCSQGDNIQDAVGLATHLNAWLNMVHVHPVISHVCVCVCVCVCVYSLYVTSDLLNHTENAIPQFSLHVIGSPGVPSGSFKTFL